MSAAVIRLSPADNVAVACRTLQPGEHILLDGIELAITQRIELGHKIAITHLETGDKVLKYGMPIGSVTAPIPAGGWLHMHNMQSDYIPAHLRDAAGDYS